jgi:hypothetical protein
MARHTSPPGTYERIWKDLLEDWTLTDAERSLMVYLATLPDGWVIHHEHLRAVTGRSANWVRLTCRALAARGILVTARSNNPDGTLKTETRVRRSRLVTPREEPGTDHHEGDFPPNGATWDDAHKPRSHRGEVSPPVGETSPLEKTHRPSEDSQDQDQASGGPTQPPGPPVLSDANQSESPLAADLVTGTAARDARTRGPGGESIQRAGQ